MFLETIQQPLIDNVASIIILSIFSIIVSILSYIKRDLITNTSKNTLSFCKSTFKKIIAKIFKFEIQNIDKLDKNNFDPFNVLFDKAISNELTELRIKTTASRAALFQFHNGEVFLTNESIWKISNTHESCANGISSVIEYCQDIKSSLFITLLSVLFTKNDIIGISKVHIKCPKTNLPCIGKRGIYKITPNLLTSDFIKGFIMNRAAITTLCAPIIDYKDTIIGILMIDYCENHFKLNENNKNDFDFICTTMCETATKIGTDISISSSKKYNKKKIN